MFQCRACGTSFVPPAPCAPLPQVERRGRGLIAKGEASMSSSPNTQLATAQPVNAGALEHLSPTAISKRFDVVQQIAKAVMVKDIDYGLIPGCGDKPALFKPGAEALCAAFMLVPKLDIQTHDLPGGHREYTVTCTLSHAPTGAFCGQGVGMCSTMESKYRYRGTQVEPTGKGLPKGYWEMGPTEREKALASAMGAANGREFTHKKIDGNWQIVRKTSEKSENADPADQYNTALKMAKKRALVDAALTATAASRLFGQDLEDLEEMIANAPKWVDGAAAASAPPPPNDPPKQSTKPSESKATPDAVLSVFRQIDALVTMADLEGIAKKKPGEWNQTHYTLFRNIVTDIRAGAKQIGDVIVRLAQAPAADGGEPLGAPPSEATAREEAAEMFGG